MDLGLTRLVWSKHRVLYQLHTDHKLTESLWITCAKYTSKVKVLNFFLRVIKMFIILTFDMCTQMYPHVKTHSIVHFKHV